MKTLSDRNPSSFTIRSALVCDGSGAPAFEADVSVLEGFIASIGKKIPSRRGIPEIDGKGLVLAPGFIDVHAHSDLSLLAAPEAFGKISQGVTTEISGNCGLSAFPVKTNIVREHLNELYQGYSERVTWNDFNSFAKAISYRVPCVNAMFLCGYNTLRANVCGYENVPDSEHGTRRMRNLLREALFQGAAGLSTGLLYVPGKFASEQEISSVASVLREFDLPHATHLRSEGAELVESVREAIRISRSGANRLQLSHLKTAKKENFHKLPEVLSLIDDAVLSGMIVGADRYPYTFAQTSLSVILPPPFDSMTDAAILENLHGNDARCAELERVLNSTKGCDWNGTILCSSRLAWANRLFGMTISDASAKLGISPANLTVRLMRDDAVGAMAAFGGLSERNLETILSRKFVCCGTDETARPCDESIGRSHPRGFGSFPRFFNMVREICTMEEAVRRMTSLPAELFSIRGRGRICAGFHADLVLFDPADFRDRADFVHPHTPASGVKAVWVNGVLSFDGSRVAARAGVVVRPRE